MSLTGNFAKVMEFYMPLLKLFEITGKQFFLTQCRFLCEPFISKSV